jgi:Protein of unknown function (DUF2752)
VRHRFPDKQRFRALATIAALSLAASGAILFFFDPAHYDFYPSCFLRSITGLNCPGCGALRAIHELLHGHIVAALRLNLYLVLSHPFWLWLLVREGVAWLRGEPMAFDIHRPWIWTFVALAFVFTVLRNLPGFDWMRT